MKSMLSYAIVGFVLVAATEAAFAQNLGDAKAGSEYASQICGECHAVQADARVSPNNRAPTFQAVANSRGMNEMALRAWFQTAHPTMPNLVIKGKDADDVIAYILSLKRDR